MSDYIGMGSQRDIRWQGGRWAWTNIVLDSRRTSAPDAANSWVSSLMGAAFRRVVYRRTGTLAEQYPQSKYV